MLKQKLYNFHLIDIIFEMKWVKIYHKTLEIFQMIDGSFE